MRTSLRTIVYRAYARARRFEVDAALESIEADFRQKSPGAIRGDALARLLQHCRDHVPYYRTFLHGQTIDAENAGDVLRSLPYLTKDIIRSQGDSLVSDDLSTRTWFRNTSGGSTGEPVRLIQDRHYADESRASSLWIYRRMGYEFGDRLCRIWGDEREILHQEPGVVAHLRAWMYNTMTLNAFRMTPERMREYLGALDARPARLILAYVQSAHELAAFARSESIRIRPQGAMTCSAGTLYPFMRQSIAEVFGCPIYNYYGSREVGLIASELPDEDGLWVPPWTQVVEIIDDRTGMPVASGTDGEIVVTCLQNRAMPLLRYRIGDRGALATTAPDDAQRLASVRGRVVDVFRRPDGAGVDGEYFTHLLYGQPWVNRFQFVQTAVDRIELKIVLESRSLPPSQKELGALQAATAAAMGPECRLEVRFVDDIPPATSGKYRYTICELPTSVDDRIER